MLTNWCRLLGLLLRRLLASDAEHVFLGARAAIVSGSLAQTTPRLSRGHGGGFVDEKCVRWSGVGRGVVCECVGCEPKVHEFHGAVFSLVPIREFLL